MTLLEKYLQELNKKDDIKIHPKRKTGMSIAGLADPLDDYAFAAIGAKKFLDKVKAKPNASIMRKAGGMAAGAAIGVAAGAAMIAGYRIIRSWFDKCTKTCGTFQVNRPKRQLCMLKCKKVSLDKQLSLMKQHKVDQKKIDKAITNLNIVNKKISLYNQYLKKNPQKKEKK